jgi:hypothetical protein
MNRTALILAAALSLAGLAARAESPDPAGQFAARAASTVSRAQVEAELRAFRQHGVDPWADEYDQLASFRSGRTRAEVVGEFLANRDAAAAMNAEDSGSGYLAAHKPAQALPYLAGTPRNAQ